MKLAFQAFLAKNGIAENELSDALRKNANEIHKLVKALSDAEEKLKDENLTVKKREELTQDVADANELIPQMDKTLTAKIKKWSGNRAVNLETGKKLAAARAAKAAGVPAAPVAGPVQTTGAPVADPPAPAAPATQTPVPPKKGEPAIPIKEEKKGSGAWWKWGLGLVATVVLGAVGVQMYRNYTDKGL